MKIIAYKTWKKQQIEFRKILSRTISSEFIEVKPMPAPTLITFYLDCTYEKHKKENNTNRGT